MLAYRTFLRLALVAVAVATSCLATQPVRAHEHTAAVAEQDRKFLDELQRPDNSSHPERNEKNKSCCTNIDATEVKYVMVKPKGEKYPEPEWYVWVFHHTKSEYTWEKVPPEKISPEFAPSGRAYVYFIGRDIQCFVRPDPRI